MFNRAFRKFSTNVNKKTNYTSHNLFSYYALTTFVFTTGGIGVGGLIGFCEEFIKQKNDKDYDCKNSFHLEAMYYNTFNMAFHIAGSSFLCGSIGFFWPFAIPVTINMLLEYKNKNNEKK